MPMFNSQTNNISGGNFIENNITGSNNQIISSGGSGVMYGGIPNNTVVPPVPSPVPATTTTVHDDAAAPATPGDGMSVIAPPPAMSRVRPRAALGRPPAPNPLRSGRKPFIKLPQTLGLKKLPQLQLQRVPIVPQNSLRA